MTPEQIELRRRLLSATCPVSEFSYEALMLHVEAIARTIEAKRGA